MQVATPINDLTRRGLSPLFLKRPHGGIYVNVNKKVHDYDETTNINTNNDPTILEVRTHSSKKNNFAKPNLFSHEKRKKTTCERNNDQHEVQCRDHDSRGVLGLFGKVSCNSHRDIIDEI